jgi:PAS domain S-box-containing protein
MFLVAGSALYLGLVQPALRRSIIEREHDRMRMYAELVALRIDNPPVGRTDRPSNPPGINVLPSLPKEWRGVLLSQDGKVLASLSPAPAAPVQPAFTGSSGTWRLDAGPHSNEVRVVEVGSQRWHECRRLFGYDAFFFDVVDEPIGGHTTVIAEDTPPGGTEPVALDSPAQQFSKPVQPIFQGEPILLNRPEDPVQSELRTWGFETRRSRSLMFTPIRWENRCTGVISAQSYHYRKFARRDLEVLQLIADQCGPALARVRSEAALRQSRQFVHQIAELMPNVLYVFDLDLGHNIFINREVSHVLGYPDAEVEAHGNHFIRQVMHPEDLPRFVIHLDQVKRLPEGGVSDFEYRLRHKDGSWCWFHSRDAVFARHVDGRIRQIIGTATEITARKNAEAEISALNENLENRVRDRTAQLEAANKELEAFSYSVSHDLRAPLRHVSGFAGLLRGLPSLAGDADARRLTASISDAARRMGNLIDDLLVFSRMGRTELRTGPVDLGALVLQVREELRSALAAREVDWRIHPLPIVSGDTAMFRLVFQNLMDNALKYSQPRPHVCIEIGSHEEPDEFVVYVRDNGVGFDMKYAGNLFGVFHRLHRDEEFDGTGIGLANVRRIVARHGGRTWAEGRLNEGAVFYFSLPKSDAPAT